MPHRTVLRRALRRRYWPQYGVLALTAALVLGFTLRSAMMLDHSYDRIIADTQTLLDSQARAAEVVTEHAIAAIDTMLLRIAALPESDAGAEPNRVSMAAAAGRLGITRLLLLDRSGKVPDSAEDYAGARFFVAQRDPASRGLFVGVLPGDRRHPRQLVISRPRLRDGAFAGVVAATAPVSAFADPIGEIRGQAPTKIALLQADGNVIASAPAPATPVPARLLAELPRRGGVLAGTRDGLYSLRRLNDSGLVVAASRDRRHLLRGWNSEFLAVMVSFVLVAVTVIALGYAVLRALGRHQLAVARMRLSEARLRRQSALLQSTLDNIGEGLSVFSKRGRLMAWNARFCELLELPAGLVAHRTLLEILTLQAERGDFGPKPPLEEAQRRFAAFYREVPAVKERVMPNGRILQIRRYQMPEGAVVSLYADISEIKASERKLIEARRQAELASRAKSDFLANMSHELRTPLNAIIGFSEMISAEIFGPVLEKRQLEYIRDIHASGLHLLSIINDVLDMSKIEAGKFELASEPVVVQRVIAEAVRIVSERAQSRQLDLVIDLPARNLAIVGDRRALKQILLNLLSNAIKFSHQGGRIEIRGALDPAGVVVIEVEDFGIGMAEADLERVLQPFNQTRAVTTKAYGGTGLGLPITKGLVNAHGGQLTIRSRLGSGTVVRVALPQGVEGGGTPIGDDRQSPPAAA